MTRDEIDELPENKITVIKIRMTSDNGIRYFHSNFRIWSIRRRGNVQRTHIRSHTTAKVLPKNQMKPGMRFIRLSKPSIPVSYTHLTKQAIGTDAISRPRKNRRKWLALTIMFIPSKVEIISI